MPDRLPMCSLAHVARFALVASSLYLLWCHVAPAYSGTLIAPANWLLHADQLPATLAQCGDVTVMSWPQVDGSVRYLQIRGHEAAYLNIVAALSLIFVIPGLSVGQRIKWTIGVVLVFWVTHAAVLYSGGYSAIGEHLSSLSSGARHALLAGAWGGFSPDRAVRLGSAVGIWTAWVSPAALALAWMLTAPANARRPT